MAQGLRNFIDIVSAIREELGIQPGDVNSTNKIKRMINMVYLNEVIPYKRWRWLEKTTQITHKAYHSVDTVSVTNGSASVTLNTAPNASLGSFVNYRFSIDGQSEVYTVQEHTAGSASLTLSHEYAGPTDATANYKIWRDKLPLPTNCQETVEVWHAKHSDPVKAVGWQRFREYEASAPKLEGFPTYSNTTDFYDPTPGDSESESDRYRQLRIYPSITQTPVVVNIDYIEQVTELDADTDEPVLPKEDWSVLVHGAAAYAWRSIARNEETSQLRYGEFLRKLERMAGETEDGFDSPSIAPRSEYLSALRNKRGRAVVKAITAASGSTIASPTYAKDIILEGGTITADFAVNDGVTIDGVDVSELNDDVQSAIAPTTVTLTDNTTAGVAVTFDANADGTAIFVDYSLTRGTGNKEVGHMVLMNDGTNAYKTEYGTFTQGTPGVTFDVQVNGSGNLELQYDTTSTGENATFKYAARRWTIV